MRVVWAQPVPDNDFKHTFTKHAYLLNKGPRVVIDEGHNNLHTKDVGLLPLVKMLTMDGYQVAANTSRISSVILSTTDIYVIVNPLHDTDVGNWVVPNPSAFSKDEINVIANWVKNGGSLLLVADHMPYAGAVQDLGKEFGIEWNNGFVIREGQHWPPSVFERNSGTLKATKITDGNEPFEQITKVATFTGSVFKAPKNSKVFLEFDDSHNVLMPDTAWQFNKKTKVFNSKGWHQGAFFEYGKGKVVILGEAAMITAQIINDGFKVGISSPQAPENAQLVLNIFHYLSGHDKYVDTNEILDANLRAMETAFKNGRMIEVAQFYADDAIIMGPNRNDQKGRKQVDEYWQSVRGLQVDWKLTTIERKAIGNQIHEVGTSELTYKSGASNITSKTRFYLIWELIGSEYKIKLDFYHVY